VNPFLAPSRSSNRESLTKEPIGCSVETFAKLGIVSPCGRNPAIGSSDPEMTDTLSIFACADRNVAIGLSVMLYSVLHNVQAGIQVEITLFDIDLTKKQLDQLTRILENTRKPYVLKRQPISLEALVREHDLRPFYGGYAPYLKLLLPESVESSRPAVYLDTDIVVCCDLTEVARAPLAGKIIGAVTESPIDHAFERTFYLQQGFQEKDTFFNAGMIVIDCDAWREAGITPECINAIQTHGQNMVGDQTVLNLVFRSNYQPLAARWNQLAFPSSKPANPLSAVGIYHLVGRPKPWEFLGEFFNRQSGLFYHYLDMTAIAGWRSYWHPSPESLGMSLRLSRSYYTALRNRRGT
jgi:lipopolysaccharide biosynthesis glycosyltransferase